MSAPSFEEVQRVAGKEWRDVTSGAATDGCWIEPSYGPPRYVFRLGVWRVLDQAACDAMDAAILAEQRRAPTRMTDEIIAAWARERWPDEPVGGA